MKNDISEDDKLFAAEFSGRQNGRIFDTLGAKARISPAKIQRLNLQKFSHSKDSRSLVFLAADAGRLLALVADSPNTMALMVWAPGFSVGPESFLKEEYTGIPVSDIGRKLEDVLARKI